MFLAHTLASMKAKQITTLFFDFGNVLLPIDVPTTYDAFAKLGAKSSLQKEHILFHAWERGTMRPDEFVTEIRSELKFAASSPSIWAAWNAMILPFPQEHLNLLRRWRKKYRLVLVSNINHEHEQFIRKMMGPFGYGHFLRQFHGIYYSHHTGMRKPEPAFFKKILADQNVKSKDVLFIDDTEENIRAAEKLGIAGWHFNPAKDSLSDLDKVLKAHHS